MLILLALLSCSMIAQSEFFRARFAKRGSDHSLPLLSFVSSSVSREFGAPPPTPKPPTEAKRGGLKRMNGRGAGGGIAANQSTVTVRRVGSFKKSPTQTGCAGGEATTRIVTDDPPVGDPKDIGTPDSPIWNHHASFDVIAPGRTILLCVYDKLAPQGGFPAHGFLGASVFEPPLSAEVGEDGLGLDVWLP